MIIRPIVSREYTPLPNSILNDDRLSADTRTMIALVLSKPKGWELRPKPLAKALSRKTDKPVGRKRLARMFREATAAGYMARSQEQSHQYDGSFGSYVYFVGLPDDVAAAIKAAGVAILPQFPDAHALEAHTPDAHAPRGTTNHKEQNLKTTESKKPLPKVLPQTDGPNGQASRKPLIDGQEVIQHRLAERLGYGNIEQGYLILLGLADGRRDELTAMQRVGTLSDVEIARARAAITGSRR